MKRISRVHRKNLLDCAYCGRMFLTPRGRSPALCPKCEREARKNDNTSEILSNMMGD